LALAYQDIRYTTEEKLIDIGPLKGLTANKKKTSLLPPIIGGNAPVSGLLIR